METTNLSLMHIERNSSSAFPVRAHKDDRENSGRPRKAPEQTGIHRRRAKGNRVLMFGRIRELALYRAAVMTDRGFEVTTPETQQQAIESIRKGGFDIAVLSYTLSNDAAQELAELVREYCPECPLIAISNNQTVDRIIDPDAMVNADDGPAALIAALRRLTGLN